MRNFVFFIFCFTAFATVNAQQWGLYTLYAPQNSTKAYLIDTSDSPVTYKTWLFSSSAKTGYSTYLTQGDTIVRTVSSSVLGSPGQGGKTGKVQKVAWDGTLVWDFAYSSSTYCLHHDICPMPNGNVLMISYEVKTTAEAVQAGCSSSISIWSEKIIEVRPTGATTGTIVWEWHLWDHLCQNYNSEKDNYVTSIIQNPQLMNINYKTTQDWIHMNGIDYNVELDQIALSSHCLNEVYVIDHSTTTAEAAGHTGGNSGKGGDFLYRWGNPASYGATGTTIFNVVHDAHWVSSDNPNYPDYLCAYNNKGGTGGKTCVDIWNPPANGYNFDITLGSAYTPSTYEYRYNSSFSARDLGNSEQLPNGNMLICNPMGAIYEINSSGTILWTKTGANSPHAYRFTKCAVRGPIVTAGASSMEISAGTEATLSSSANSVSESSPTYSYSWSSEPSGFTSSSQNPSVTPASTTTYIVTITNTDIDCSGTASVTINVNATGIDKVNYPDNISVFPNPTTGMIIVNGNFTKNDNFEILIYDIYGKMILHKINSKTIDISGLRNGLYLFSVISEKSNIFMQKITLIK